MLGEGEHHGGGPLHQEQRGLGPEEHVEDAPAPRRVGTAPRTAATERRTGGTGVGGIGGP